MDFEQDIIEVDIESHGVDVEDRPLSSQDNKGRLYTMHRLSVGQTL